jgi:hypothetical protein
MIEMIERSFGESLLYLSDICSIACLIADRQRSTSAAASVINVANASARGDVQDRWALLSAAA